MKAGWEIKKLGEVCDIICGRDYKSVKDDNGKYPIYGTGGIMGYANQYICPANSVIIGRKGSINNPIYVETEFWNVDTAFGVVPKTDILNPKFFFLFCKDYDFTRHDVSVTIPSLRRTDILKISIPIPPLSEQEQIVSELDLISGIIEKKKQQLKELDSLAQSIFYEMFGNPVENDRGWEVKKLDKVCVFQQGIQVPIEEQFEEQQEGMVRFLRIVDFTQGNEKPRYVYVNSEKHILKEGEIAIVRYGTPGFVCYGKYGAIANNLFKIIPLGKDISYSFFIYWLNSEAFQSVVVGNQYGAALQAIKFSTIKDIVIILPPLSLQQEFASKIESIERQKELIKQSLKDTETLFNSRMDFYFN